MEPTNQELIDALKLILSKYEEAVANKLSFNELRKQFLHLGICCYMGHLSALGIISEFVFNALEELIYKDTELCRIDGYLFPTPYQRSFYSEKSMNKICIIPRIEYLKEKINILELKTVVL